MDSNIIRMVLETALGGRNKLPQNIDTKRKLLHTKIPSLSLQSIETPEGMYELARLARQKKESLLPNVVAPMPSEQQKQKTVQDISNDILKNAIPKPEMTADFAPRDDIINAGKGKIEGDGYEGTAANENTGAGTSGEMVKSTRVSDKKPGGINPDEYFIDDRPYLTEFPEDYPDEPVALTKEQMYNNFIKYWQTEGQKRFNPNIPPYIPSQDDYHYRKYEDQENKSFRSRWKSYKDQLAIDLDDRNYFVTNPDYKKKVKNKDRKPRYYKRKKK